jgi:hypothetical protein
MFAGSGNAIVVRNLGSGVLDWTASVLPGADWLTIDLVKDIAIGQIRLAYSTNRGGDSRTATVHVEGNAPNSPIDVQVTQAGTPPTLSVVPAHKDVGASAGNATFNVINIGGGTLAWQAAVIQGAEWLMITAGATGTDADEIHVAYVDNLDAGERTAVLRVAATGANDSPKTVTLTQAGHVPGTGAILVTLEPEAARNDAAQWRVDGGNWLNSGQTIANVTAGTHTIEFQPIDATSSGCFAPAEPWTTPPAQSVTVIENQTTAITATYVQEPAKAQAAGIRGDAILLALAAATLAATGRKRSRARNRK